MMKFLLVLSVVVAAALALPTDEFEAFKARFNKVYKNEQEEQQHKQIFLNKIAYINQHNADSSRHGYTLGINEFSDLDPAVLLQQRNGYLGSMKSVAANTTTYQATGVKLPESVDWRDKGYVTKVKNQGQCGSCWAFSTTGSLEGQHFKKTGNLVSLSEQQLVDCSEAEGNHGCKGGLMVKGFEYIKKNGGDDTEESYPYKAENGKCHFKEADIGATCTGYVQIKKKDCNGLKEAIATIGPISVAMDASEMSFQEYRSGIYKPKRCSSTKLDHGVLAVGYGTENGVDYWIIKNSWGRSWGMEGYFKIASADDLCGICTAASYPTV